MTNDDEIEKVEAIRWLTDIYEDEVEARKALKILMMAVELSNRGYSWKDV
jgi:hypothetical protein